MPHSVDIPVGDKTITVETGKMALLAAGSCTLRQGDTILLVTACSAPPREGLDFFPLQVDYREKFSAAGRFPGGYFKREGRPSEKEILTCRLTDRPLRPLFPKGFYDDTQIQALLLSADGQNEPDMLCILGASIALALSDIPFGGPTGGLRVGRIDGTFIANPTHDEMAKSDLDLVYAGIADKVIMIEGGCDELSEEDLVAALEFANDVVKTQIEKINELVALAGKTKRVPALRVVPDAITAAMQKACEGKLREGCMIADKNARYAHLDQIRDAIIAEIGDQFDEISENPKRDLKDAFTEETQRQIRDLILSEGARSDHRAVDELRPLSSEVAVLPTTHGSALFSRGETQALVVATLASEKETQGSDGITGGETEKKFILHYNFPNFSVGETGRIMGPGRREVGHGALAERAVERMMPKDFPYAVRCVSEVMGSNGSTSMASVCAASLALMDAGVPLIKPVAGISVGLVKEGEKYLMLTDILGSEDHYGDMDFKVTGTRDGITAFQLDLKIAGLSIAMMTEALERNKSTRMAILDNMDACIAAPRAELNANAPRITIVKINPEKIGALIGPGGKNIRGICEEFGVQIDVAEDGTVKIYSNDGESMKGGVRAVQSCTAEVEIGRIYRGEVKTIREFGAFVEILPGQDGLLHISEMADYRVANVEDICQEGDTVPVKVIDIDDRGRVRLSRKAALAEMDED